MIRTVRNLLTIDPGFRADGVLTMRLSTPSLWYPDSQRVVAFWDDLQRRVASLPGVTSVAAVRLLPLSTEMGDWGVAIDGYTPPPEPGVASRLAGRDARLLRDDGTDVARGPGRSIRVTTCPGRWR